jgi:tape measure domain-containing protein
MRTVLSADATQFHATMRKAAMSARAVGEKMGRSMNKAATSMANIAKSAGKAAIAVGGVVTAAAAFGAAGLVKSSLKIAANFEQISVTMANFVGGAENAAEILAEVSSFSTVTPFETTGLQETVNLLLGAGIAAEDAVDVMKELAAVSKNTGQVGELGDALAKGFAKGKFQTEELNKFLERGINLMPELERVTGKTGVELQKSIQAGLKFEDVRRAIAGMSAEGGLFFGMLEKQSTTTTGLVSTLSSNWDEFRTKIGQPINEGLKPLLELAIERVQQLTIMAPMIGDYLAQRLPEVLKTIMEAANQAFIFGQRMMQAVDLARVGLGAVFSADFWAMVGLRMQAAFLDAVNVLNRGLAGVIAGLQSALGVVSVALGSVFEEMQKPSFWSGLGNTLGGIAVSFAGKMAELIANVLEKISKIPGVGKLLGGAVESTREMASNLSAQGAGMMERGASGIAPMQKIMKEAAENGAAAFGEAFTSAFDNAGDAFDTSKIKAAAANLAAPVAGALADILNRDIKTLPDLVAKVMEYAESNGGQPAVDPEKQALMDKVASHHAAGFSGLGGLAQMQLDKANGIGVGTTGAFAKDRARLGIGSGLTSGGIGAKRAVGRGKDEAEMKRQAELAKSSEEHLMEIKETIGKSLSVS